MQDSSCNEETFIKGVQQNGTPIQPVNGVVNVTVQDGEDGKSAFEIAQQQGYTGTVDQWLASLKANIGEFLFVPTDAAAVTAMSTIGQTYSSAIDPQGKNVTPSQNTLSVILLMNAGTTPDKTMMIATQDDGNNGYEFVYAGNLQDAMPSNVLTEDNIINDFTGGVNDVASAETVKTLNEGKIDKQVKETSYSSVSSSSITNTYVSENGTTSSTAAKTYFFPVTPGKTYKISGRFGTSTSYYLYAFYNESTHVQSFEKFNSSDFSNYEKVDVEVTIPNSPTITHIAVGNYQTNTYTTLATCDEKVITVVGDNQAIIDSVGDVTNLETTEKQTVVGAINEVAGAVNEMGDVSGAVEKIDAIAETVVSPNMFDKANDVLTGYYLSPTSSNGKLTTADDNYKISQPIKVIPGHYYYIAGRPSIVRAIRCLAENATSPSDKGIKALAPSNGEVYGNSWALPNVDGSSYANNGQFKVPTNADYVQFTLSIEVNGSQVGSVDSVMLTHVGDTYNPDYVVPAYQPYGSSTKVKPSAIDCDDTPVEDSEKPITSGGVYEALQGITPQTEGSKKLSVLLIGSSHGVNTISMFPALCKGAGIDIVCGNLYSGSATIGNTPSSVSPNVQIPYKARFNNYFERFAVYEDGEWQLQTTKTLQYALQNYKWDVVIVQRGNTEVTVWNDIMDGYLQYLLDYIKDNCVINGISYTPTIYFNSGIANGSSYGTATQVTTTTNIIATAETMKSRWGIDVIPVAIALQYARKTILHTVGAWNPTDGGTAPDLTYDGQHLDTGVGQYVMACCVFEKIVKDFFNMSVRELDYIPVYSDISGNTTNATESYFTPITEYYSRIGKTCAALACIDGEYNADTVTYLQSRFGAEPVQYNITYNLTNCSLNDTRATIMSDDVYMANFTPNSGYTLDTSTVNLMMNGVDVTSNVFVHNSTNSIVGIRIGEITGDIVITASAIQS